MPEEGRFSQLATYEDLFERMLDPVFLVDPASLQILDTNAASERFLKVPHEHILSQKLTHWIEPETLDEFIKELRVAKRHYYSREFESSWKTPSGNRVLVKIAACMLKLSAETAVLQVIARDITRERETELQTQKLMKEITEANAKLEALSQTDEMTQLPNFRYFKTELTREHEVSLRYGMTYSVIFCDVDHFKFYNDHHGHPAGDEALKLVATLIKTNSRTVDIVSRYGGEEFVVLCPQTNSEQALVLAERIRKAIETTEFPNGEQQPLGKVSISVGVASFPEHGKTAREILKASDEAVYYSKQHGRNQVTSFSLVKPKKKAPKSKAA